MPCAGFRVRPLAKAQRALTTRGYGRFYSSRGRSYNDALDLLNTLQTPFSVYQARMAAGIRPDASSLTEMRSCLARIGYSTRDLDRLNVLHVAGTKGKGSVCAYADSILGRWRQSRGVPAKVGLFTSPHLVSVRERIRIDSEPIGEDLFARYFFDVWDRLEATRTTAAAAVAAGDAVAATAASSYDGKPAYARYLTLMSWHVFLSERVDAAVYETGIGGEYDATNIVERPLATAITTLGIDHVFALGDTIDRIAWHKAGVIKAGSTNYTVRHEAFPEAERVLRQRAAEKGAELSVLHVDPRLSQVKIKPDWEFQKKNATLGIALAEAALRKLDPSFQVEDRLPREFVDGLEQVSWRGRCEVKEEDGIRWHIDGAHTLDSLKLAGNWYSDEVKNRPGPRVLIFNQQSRSEAAQFLKALYEATKLPDGKAFDLVIFCSNKTHAGTGFKREFVNHTVDAAQVNNLQVQKAFAEEWAKLDRGVSSVLVIPSIQEAVQMVRQLAADPLGSRSGKETLHRDQVQALVTGSIHLVGGVLEILEGGSGAR